MTEQELAAKLVRYLEAQNWLVCQEVIVGDCILDIAAIRGGDMPTEKLMAIEVKLNNDKDLIEQALRWKAHSNLTAIATGVYNPDTEYICVEKDLGYFTIAPDVEGAAAVREVTPPIYRYVRSEDIYERIRPKGKSFAPAGMASGRRATDWNLAAGFIVEYLRDHPGSSVEEAHDAVRDRSWSGREMIIKEIKRRIKRGEYPGLRLSRFGVEVDNGKEV